MISNRQSLQPGIATSCSGAQVIMWTREASAVVAARGVGAGMPVGSTQTVEEEYEALGFGRRGGQFPRTIAVVSTAMHSTPR